MSGANVITQNPVLSIERGMNTDRKIPAWQKSEILELVLAVDENRKLFVSSAYFLVLLYICIGCLHVLPVLFLVPIKKFLYNYLFTGYIFGISSLLCLLFFLNFPIVRKVRPYNYILAGLTLEFSNIILMLFVTHFDKHVVGIVFTITISSYVFFSFIGIIIPCDLTRRYILMNALGIFLVLFGLTLIVLTFLVRTQKSNLVFSAIALLFLLCFSSYQAQIVFGGRYIQMKFDQQLMASILLYMHVFVMYIIILSLAKPIDLEDII